MSVDKPLLVGERYAAVDIGSNAVRLIIGVVDSDGILVESFIRLPLQLGGASFSNQRILPEQNLDKLQKTLTGMRYFIDAMQPVCAWRVVATAALRGAANLDEILAGVQENCGITIKVLSGDEEAALVGRFVAKQFRRDDSVLNIDVGGGSTDCALLVGGDIACVDSFAVGTARAGGGEEAEKQRMIEWLQARSYTAVCGSGGSVRILESLCKELSAAKLDDCRKKIASYTPAEISRRFDLSPDRAAHLMTAIDIYHLLASVTGGVIHSVSGGLAEAVLHDIAFSPLR